MEQPPIQLQNAAAERAIASEIELKRFPLSQSIVAGGVAATDMLAVYLSGLLPYLLYVHERQPSPVASYQVVMVLFSLILVRALAAGGFYRFERIVRPWRYVLPVMWRVSAAFGLLLALAFALKVSEEYSRVWVFAWFGATLILMPALRSALAGVLRRLARKGLIGRNIVIFGAGAEGVSLIERIRSRDEPWNQIVAVFDERATRTETEHVGYAVRGNLTDLLEWARTHRVDDVLLALPLRAEDRLMQLTRVLSVLPITLRLSPGTSHPDVLYRNLSNDIGIPMFRVMARPMAGWPAVVKRAMDLVLGGAILVAAAPLLLLIALAVKLDSPGPVLFRQRRLGFNNQTFDIFKFRTMYREYADPLARRLTVENDPRVTRVGAVLRRFSLDELPQLINVLKGDMSLVGPRPHALAAKAGDTLYEEVVDRYAVRHKVKPGITGWAQVNGWRGNTTTEADLIGRIEHDLYYIEHWSITLDLIIIARTLPAVIRGENSY